MVKCKSSKNYMELLNKMKRKNVQINVHKNVQINSYEKLTKIEKLILDIILEEPEVTQSNIAIKLDTSTKTIQRGISSLIFYL